MVSSPFRAFPLFLHRSLPALPLFSRSTSLFHDLSTSSTAICVARTASINFSTDVYTAHSKLRTLAWGLWGGIRIPAYPSKQLFDSLCRCFLVLLPLSCPVERHAIKAKFLFFFFFLFFAFSLFQRISSEVERFVLLANNLIAPQSSEWIITRVVAEKRTG